MKKLSQNKRIIIGNIGITLMIILATVYIGIRYEIEIDLILTILLLGVANGFTIYKGYILWEPRNK